MNVNSYGTTARRLTDTQTEIAVYTATFTIDVQPSALDIESVAFIMDGTEAFNNLFNRATTGLVCRMFINLWPAAPDQVNSPWYANPVEILTGDILALRDAFARRWGADQQTGWFTKDGQPRRND